MFWRIESDYVGASVPQTNHSGWFDLSSIRDALPGERLVAHSTDVLIDEDINTEQAGGNCLERDSVIVGDS
jgi:hypothetical protein